MLRIVSHTGSQVLIIGLFSHADTRSHIQCTHTHAHVLQSIQKFHKIPNFHQLLNPVKRGYKSLFFFFPFNPQSGLFFFFPFNLSLYSVSHPWMALVF